VHLADPLGPSELASRIATSLVPGWRVLSASMRADVAYQVAAAEAFGFLRQFGFIGSVVVGERLSCAAALLVAVWYPRYVSRLVLVDEVSGSAGDSLAERSLRACPPDRSTLRASLPCPVFDTSMDRVIEDLRNFLDGTATLR
jgi:pimeloyl-ACP methyl ester carboxylesterase